MIQVHYLSILLCIESENLVETIRSKLICCLPKDFTDSLPCVLSTTRDLTRRSWTSLQIPSSFEVSRNQDFELNSILNIHYLILDENCLKSSQQLKLVNLPQLIILIAKDLACENVKELYLESKKLIMCT